MLRKRFKKLALGGLLLAALAAPGPVALAQSPPTTTVPAASPHAAIWAETAEYVYRDDQALAPIWEELQGTIASASLAAFERGLKAAQALEEKKLNGQRHVGKFKKLYDDVDAQNINLSDPRALVKAIINKLDDNKDRMADPARQRELAALKQRLNRLAAGPAGAGIPAATPSANPAGSAGAGANPNSANSLGATQEADVAQVAPTGGAATDNPMNNLAAPAADVAAAPVSSLLWLALALSGLSLAGVIYLIMRKPPASPAAGLPLVIPEAASHPKHTSRQNGQQNVTWDEVRKYVDRQLDERLPAPGAAASTAAPPAAAKTNAAATTMPAAEAATAAAATAEVVAAPRTRSQYVNEAPLNNTFPARALSEQLSNYSMFVITSLEQQPDQGSFAVAGNLASHVRDHRSVLEPVCEYVGSYPLGNEKSVITEEPGEVRRRGADWEVTRKARVRFE